MASNFFLRQKTSAACAEKRGESIETAARIVRYTQLFKIAEQHGFQAVAVGHTADDQVETLLMHLLQGSGSAGLGGMSYRFLPNPWNDQIPLIRPLLSTWREEILAYDREHALDAVMDQTNQDRQFYRNRIRHELLPYLTTFNPNARQALWQTAEINRAEQELLEQLGEPAWQACCQTQRPDYIMFDLAAFRPLPVALQRMVLRKGFNSLRRDAHAANFRSIEMALEYIGSPENPSQRSSPVDLSGGLCLIIEESSFWLADWNATLPAADWPQLASRDAEYVLAVPGAITLPGGWRLSVEVGEATSEIVELASQNTDRNQAWLDADRVSTPLYLRARCPGERIQPLGMQDSSALISDLMINHKIPRRARSLWPLVVSAEKIVWIPGLTIAHSARLTDRTQNILHLRISNK